MMDVGWKSDARGKASNCVEKEVIIKPLPRSERLRTCFIEMHGVERVDTV